MPVLKLSRRLLFLTIVIIALLAGAIIGFPLLNRPSPWVRIAEWTASLSEYTLPTQPFTINGTEWRVTWQVYTNDNSSRCYVSIYDAGTNELVVELPHEQQNGTAYFNTTGTFYLKISPHGTLSGWTVQVHQRT